MTITVTVIKSEQKCDTCAETEQIVKDVIESQFKDKATLKIITGQSEDALQYGIVTTPCFAIGNKIYSMGKPVIKSKVEKWLKKELE